MAKAKTSLKLPPDFIAIDLETTGLDMNLCEIIEIAAVQVVGNRITDRFSTLVRPNNPIPAMITALTGISDDMVADKDPIEAVLPSLAEKLEGAVVVGHNVCFDDRFIQSAFSNAGISCSYNLVDTLRMSRHVNKGMDSHSLDWVASACGIDISEPGQRHRALYDAEITALCAISMGPQIADLYGDNPDKTPTAPKVSELMPTIDVVDESNPFFGSRVLFTGALSSMTRAEAMQKAVNLGAVPVKSFSKKVDYLIVGSFDFLSNLKGDTTSKLKKAQQAIAEGSDIKIVSESFFCEFASE